jgi:hypothetical protein
MTPVRYRKFVVLIGVLQNAALQARTLTRSQALQQ